MSGWAGKGTGPSRSQPAEMREATNRMLGVRLLVPLGELSSSEVETARYCRTQPAAAGWTTDLHQLGSEILSAWVAPCPNCSQQGCRDRRHSRLLRAG